jgi:hypothetical protein
MRLCRAGALPTGSFDTRPWHGKGRRAVLALQNLQVLDLAGAAVRG